MGEILAMEKHNPARNGLGVPAGNDNTQLTNHRSSEIRSLG